MTKNCSIFILLLGILIASPCANAQSYNFNNNSDAGWTHYDPLGEIGLGPQMYYYPTGGVYHLIGTASPDIGTLGPARGGSLITTVSYTNFYVSADVISWDTNVHQIVAVGARLSNLGLGTTTGYLLDLDVNTSNPTSGDMDIARVDNEAGTSIEVGPSGITLTPGASYRFVLMGKGADLDGFVYELPNTNTPILHISANDATYTSGYSGLVIAYNGTSSGPEAVAPDAIFDNYYAAAKAPPIPLMISSDSVNKTVTVSWAAYPGCILQSTPSLTGTPVWTDETPTSTTSTINSFEAPIGAGGKYFRLVN